MIICLCSQSSFLWRQQYRKAKRYSLKFDETMMYYWQWRPWLSSLPQLRTILQQTFCTRSVITIREVLRAACDLNAIAHEVQDVFWMRETATSCVSSQLWQTCDGQRAKGQLCFMHVSATEKEKRFSLQDSEAFDPMVGRIVGCLKSCLTSMHANAWCASLKWHVEICF